MATWRGRSLVAALAALVAAGVGACGGDEEDPAPSGGPPATGTSETPRDPVATAESAPPAPPEEPAPSATAPAPTGPAAEGDGGGTEPVRSDAVVTGRAGRIRPAVVRVPPFIAVRLELRSGDGARYALRVAGRTIVAAAGRPVASVMLDGLQPGDRYVARAGPGSAARNGVQVVASAEPGP